MINILLIAANIVTAPMLPDPKMTPGATNPAITQANIQTTICVPGYTAKAGIRNVSEATKKAVFAEYRYDPKTMGAPEVDHLISLEIGGANDIKNLWPQSYTSTPYNAHIKDALENRLHSMICKGTITLEQGQKEVSTDWVAAYKKYFSK